MKAVITTAYGPPEVLKIQEANNPVPKDGEVLIKIKATTCHVGDTRVRAMRIPFWYKLPFRLMMGIIKPKKGKDILGMECAGDVDAVGKDVTRFKPGDAVFALTGFSFGGYAEYRCLPTNPKPRKGEVQGIVALKPKNMSYEEAATVPGGALTALTAMRALNIQPGEEMLIYGASGSLGLFALQIAKDMGAKVTGVCSTANLELVKSMGADEVVDYTKGNLTEIGKKYDVIYDAVYLFPRSRFRRLLKEGGRLRTSHDSLIGLNNEDLEQLREMIEAEKLKTFIDKTYPLEDIVEAHRYVDTGRKRGNVVITVG